MMFIKFNNINKLLSNFINGKHFYYGLVIFNYCYVFLNIYTSTIFLGVIFLLINALALLQFDKVKSIHLIFLLYPLARVLKIPGFETSLFTILLFLFYIRFAIILILNKISLTHSKVTICILYLIYVLFSFIISIFNRDNDFRFLSLFSYYLYLALPLVVFIFFEDRSQIRINESIIFFSASYLYGLLLTIFYYKVIPNGSQMLQQIGVNVFEIGSSIVRYSPLTDDPNYGTALILLLGGLFLVSKKSKMQAYLGYPIIVFSLIISSLSLSKMFILCLLIVMVFLILKLMVNTDHLLLNSITLLFLSLTFIFFLRTNLGNSLIIRMFGDSGKFSLDVLTTGRSELFGAYSSYILSNPIVLVFGKGPLYSDFSIFTHGEHNSFTKSVYANGLFGVTLMVCIFLIMAKNRFDKRVTLPKNITFWGFLLTLMICNMALSITASTVFPLFVLAAQYVEFNEE